MKLKYVVLPLLFLFTFCWSFYVYFSIYHMGWGKALFYALDMFTLDLKTPEEISVILDDKESVIKSGEWIWIYLAGISASIFAAYSLSLIILKLFERNVKDIYRRKFGTDLLIFGLSKDNRILIDSYLRKKYHGTIIVIENKSNNAYIEEYRNKGVTVFVGNQKSKKLLQKLNLTKTKYAVVSTMNDLDNIEIALQCTKFLEDIDEGKMNLRILLRVEDRNLRNFHKDNGLFTETKLVDIYSKNEDIARNVFSIYNIDGMEPGLIHTNKEYSMILIGDTPLSLEIIYQVALMAQLPNKNKLTLYCVSENAIDFRKKVLLTYPKFEKLHKTIEFKFISLDFDNLESYQDTFWTNKMYLSNIILTYEDSQANLDIVSHLADITYKDIISDEQFHTRILIGVYNSKTLQQMVDKNDGYYKSFHIYGDNYYINNVDRVLKDDRDEIAKYVNHVYDSVKKVVNGKIIYWSKPVFPVTHKYFWQNKLSWNTKSHFVKESNRSVADHMDIKLRYLNLRKKKSQKTFYECLNINKKYFMDTYLEFEDKLAENEHIRWNTFHYLHGYQQTEYVDQEKKTSTEYKRYTANKRLHMCLRPFSELKKDESKLSGELKYEPNEHVQYDYMINYFIPYVLAASGYEIQSCDISENSEA